MRFGTDPSWFAEQCLATRVFARFKLTTPGELQRNEILFVQNLRYYSDMVKSLRNRIIPEEVRMNFGVQEAMTITWLRATSERGWGLAGTDGDCDWLLWYFMQIKSVKPCGTTADPFCCQLFKGFLKEMFRNRFKILGFSSCK